MKPFHLLAIALAVLLAACIAKNKGETDIVLRVAEPAVEPATKGRVYLAPIIDTRQFEAPIAISALKGRPVDQLSQPSVPKGVDPASLTADQKQVMIGLKRSLNGGPAAPATLVEGTTVNERTRELLVQGFRQMGYAVVDDPKAPTRAIATVDQFWGWEWRFMSAEFGANVAVTVMLERGDRSYELHAAGEGTNVGRDFKPTHWQKTFERAFKDFAQHFTAELAKAEGAGLLAADASVHTVAAPVPAANGSDARARLQELKKMFDDGLIDQAEYDSKRKEILDSF